MSGTSIINGLIFREECNFANFGEVTNVWNKIHIILKIILWKFIVDVDGLE